VIGTDIQYLGSMLALVLLPVVHTGSGADPASYSIGTGVVTPPGMVYRTSTQPVLLLGVFRDNFTFLFSIEFKSSWSYTSTPPTCLHGMYRDSFTSSNLTYLEEQ